MAHLEVYEAVNTTCKDDTCYGMVLLIKHVLQKSNWDCGVACLQMVCSTMAISEKQLEKAIIDHKLKQNVWTIDLAYLCSILGINHKGFTINTEVNSEFVNEPYYIRQQGMNFSEETERINQLFQNSNRNGVFFKKSSVTLDTIISHIILQKKPIIVLIDCSKLYPIRLLFPNFEKLTLDQVNDLDYAIVEDKDQPYAGHYILVIGFDFSKHTIIYYDPSHQGKCSECSFDTFEESRKSFGTDEDILFIYDRLPPCVD